MSSNPNTTTAGEPGGLANVSQVVELADQLSACADQIHARVMREIRSYKGEPIPERTQATARALLDDEVVLRQRANGLYADAATYIVRSLGQSQKHVLALTADAAQKIKTIVRIGDGVSLVARLLGLAAAAATGQAAPIVLALENLHHQLDAVALHNAPPPPPAEPSA
jgi:hypothetical protein